MPVAPARRLPGIDFEVKASQPAEILPRMDVAVFVGFASSGPLHIPVVVESVPEFMKVFGQDAPLAWDGEKGERIHAYLAPTVRAFFLNGGERCWVIRVANENEARYNYFPVPGLACATIDEKRKVVITGQAFARARSEGSWSDSLEVGSSLVKRPVELLDLELESSTASDASLPGIKRLVVRPLSIGEIRKGDLLLLTFREGGYSLMTPVQGIDKEMDKDASPPSPLRPDERTPVQLICGVPLWFCTKPPEDFVSTPDTAGVYMFRHYSSLPKIPVLKPPPEFDDTLTLFLDTSLERSPEPGSVVKVEVGSSAFWMTVDKRVTALTEGSPPKEAVMVTGRGMWPVDYLRDEQLDSKPSCDILTLELQVRQPNNPSVKLTGLGFEKSHDLFWGFLPTDEELYSAEPAPIPEGHHPYSLRKTKEDAEENRERPELSLQSAIHQSSADPRFPIAGPGDNSTFFFPVAMPFVPTHFLGAENDGKSSLERDGLSRFDASLFLDEDIAPSRTTDLISTADFVRYQSPAPRTLRGIHAAMGIEEATILAVPDAVHLGWEHAAPVPLTSPPEPSPISRPEHSRCPDDKSSPSAEQVKKEERRHFVDCPVGEVPSPELKVRDLPGLGAASDRLDTESGSFVLNWFSPAEDEKTFFLEESFDPGFTNPSVVYCGAETEMKMYGRSSGQYFYRVRAVVAGQTSDWSIGVSVRIGAASPWVLCPGEHYSDNTLLSVHRSSIRLCAARGDMLATLSVPVHYREEDTIRYTSTLKSINPSYRIPKSVEPLGYGETNAFSYAALYHPWPVVPVEDQTDIVRPAPPDGVVCGTVAGRALARGAWVSPANGIMKGIISLSPVISAAWHSRFQEEQINILRQEPQGFLCMNSDTLSSEEDLRPVNVRRLLSLLRRLALRHGVSYVFEPNNAAFRRRVQRGFESMLNYMYVRGAFKGTTPEAAYQVVNDETVNTSQSVEQGRFIVELRVAPSLPMRFLTIRLVQNGDRLIVAT